MIGKLAYGYRLKRFLCWKYFEMAFVFLLLCINFIINNSTVVILSVLYMLVVYWDFILDTSLNCLCFLFFEGNLCNNLVIRLLRLSVFKSIGIQCCHDIYSFVFDKRILNISYWIIFRILALL